MPSTTLTFHPDSKNTDSSTVASWLPSPSLPSRDTALKGAVVVAGLGACYWAYCSASHWIENVSIMDFFVDRQQQKDDDE